MPTKIQINSLQAIERLIGGDTETEIEIRRSIVLEFVKSHLWKLLSEDSIKKQIEKISNQVSERVQAEVDLAAMRCMVAHTDFAPTLNRHWKSEISNFAQQSVQSLVRSAIDSAVKLAIADAMEDIQKQVNSAVAHNIKYQVETAVRERVKAAMNAALEKA